jgi:hypothetical protein
VFGGKEIHYATTSVVSTGFLEVFSTSILPVSDGDPETNNASGNHLRRRVNVSAPQCGPVPFYRLISLRHSVFNTRSSLPEQPAVRWSNVPAPHAACKRYPECSFHIPISNPLPRTTLALARPSTRAVHPTRKQRSVGRIGVSRLG